MDTMTCILWSTVFDISELAPDSEQELLWIADAAIIQGLGLVSNTAEDEAALQQTA